MSNFLESIVDTLPAKAQPYAKTYAASVMAALTVISASVPDAPHWLTIVLAILGAPVVFGTPNKDPLAKKQDESVQPPDASVVETDTPKALNADGNGF